MGTTADKLARLNETKALLKTRLTEKGLDVASENNFYNLADKVREIQTGSSTETVTISINISGIADCFCCIIDQEGVLGYKHLTPSKKIATNVLKNSIVFAQGYTFSMPAGARELNITGECVKLLSWKDRENGYAVFSPLGNCKIS